MCYLSMPGIISFLYPTGLQCRRSQFSSWVGKICWRRERLPTPVFLGFPGGSAGKESACNAGDLGSSPGLGRSPGQGERLPTPIFWPGEFHGLYSPWGHKELDTTERLSLSPHWLRAQHWAQMPGHHQTNSQIPSLQVCLLGQLPALIL